MRHYDPTIGRWLSTDPYDEFASPYVGMGADPVNNIDPDGGGVFDNLAKMLGKALGGGGNAIAGAVSPSGGTSAASSGGSFTGSLGNAAGNAAAGAAGMWLANKLFPLPQGPDARILQNGGDINKGGDPSRTVTEGVTIPVTSPNGTLLGNLKVGNYHAYSDPSGLKGVYIDFLYYSVTDWFVTLKYVQTVRTNKRGTRPITDQIYTFNDPDSETDLEDEFPFYWNEEYGEQQHQNEVFQNDASFGDRPGRTVNADHIITHDITWEGEVSLVGSDPSSGRYLPLITFRYGFDISIAGQVKAKPLTIKSPSTFQQQSINSVRLKLLPRLLHFVKSIFKSK